MNPNTPPPAATGTLIKASAGAAVLAAAILTVAVLPAEYDIDPTGLGAALGLTSLAAAQPVYQSSAAAQSNFQKDAVEILIPPHSGLEYKLHLLKGEKFKYRWSTGNMPLYFDFHGEPSGDRSGYFESFTESTAHAVSGSLTAPFAGSHGWYWKNDSSEAVTVALTIEGNYQIEGIK